MKIPSFFVSIQYTVHLTAEIYIDIDLRPISTAIPNQDIARIIVLECITKYFIYCRLRPVNIDCTLIQGQTQVQLARAARPFGSNILSTIDRSSLRRDRKSVV